MGEVEVEEGKLGRGSTGDLIKDPSVETSRACSRMCCLKWTLLVLPRSSRPGCMRGCGADGIQIEVREDGPVNQSVFDTLTKKSLGQRRETGTPGLRDQMVPKSSGEGLCSDSLADLGCSQLGDPAPRVSDRPPESLDGMEPYQASLYGLSTNPAESYLAMVVVVMPRAVLQVLMLTQVSTQSSPPNQGQSSNPS